MVVLPQREDPRLVPVLSADRVWTGVTTTEDGRIFVSFPSADGPGLQVAEAMPGGRFVPYPDAGRNQACDAAGTIYLSDVEQRRILTITPDRQVDTLLADPRLIWGDAMWIDTSGHLWIPAAQLNRTPGLAGGARSVDYPVWIYKLKIDASPPANDHT